MAAATQAMPVASNGEVGQQLNLPQYNGNRLVKKEVLDPDYGTESPTAPKAGGNGTPAAETAPEKPKRANPRKPSGASKAKKVKMEPVPPAAVDANGAAINGAAQSQIQDHMPVQKKKRDRFKGTTEEEVLTRVLPDHVREDLDILIVGINPGLTAAYVQHHYAGPGNHFWKCLYLSGMIPEPMNALQDAELMNYGVGFTNIVARTTRGSADLSKKEIFEGGEILKEKMLKYLPKIALFNGKGIYEVFCGHKKFYFGLQPDMFPGCPNTCVFVNPSSSARCTQLPRAVDKVPFYEALKRVRDHIRVHGSIDGIDRSTVTFPDFKLVTAPQKVKKEIKEEPTADTNGEQGKSQAPASASNLQPGTQAAPQKAPAKPRKPRGRPKKEKAAQEGLIASSVSTPVQPNDPAMSFSNGAQHHQAFVNNKSNMPQQNAMYTELRQSQPLNSNRNTLPPDFIKQEAMDGNHPDKDLAAIIQQSINVQQSMFQQQQSMAASNMMQRSMNGTNFHPGLMMPVSVPSTVKQERPDWPGYGEMPAYTSATPTTMAAYPQYSCYWNYISHPTNGTFMNNPYSNIPPSPQIAHQQAVAAVSALHTSVSVSQPNVSSTPVVSYSSPQEASSPAMSSQSNLTQASLDSLPKADSASTVANWLQNIPNSAQ